MNKLNKKPKNEIWIAHYGGSFNPVHNGHIAVAEELVNKYGFDKIYFVPNGNAYNKSGLAPAEARLKLVEKAINGNSRFEALDWELKSDIVNHSLSSRVFRRGKKTEG